MSWLTWIWGSFRVTFAMTALVIWCCQNIFQTSHTCLQTVKLQEINLVIYQKSNNSSWLVWCFMVLYQWEQARRWQSQLFGSRSTSYIAIMDKFSSQVITSPPNFCPQRTWQACSPLLTLNCNTHCFAFLHSFPSISKQEMQQLTKWPLKCHQVVHTYWMFQPCSKLVRYNMYCKILMYKYKIVSPSSAVVFIDWTTLSHKDLKFSSR